MEKMQNITSGRRSFGCILNDVASGNAFALMERARTANKLAKALRGRSRGRAYAVKTRAVLGLTTGFPNWIRILKDVNTPGFVVVRSTATNFGLHVPSDLFKLAEPTSIGQQKWQRGPKFANITPPTILV